MATSSRTLRRGLPRVPGGEPWPPAGEAPITAAPVTPPVVERAERDETTRTEAPVGVSTPAPVAPSLNDREAGSAPAAEAPVGVSAASPEVGDRDAAASVAIRRGLPRVPGGEPWPPAGTAPVSGVSSPAPAAPSLNDREAADREDEAPSVPAAREAEAPVAQAAVTASDTPIRRGLPRVPGGEPWPPAGFAPAAPAPEPASVPELVEGRPEAAPVPVAAQVAAASPAPTIEGPLPFTPTVYATPASDRWNADRVARRGKTPIAPAQPQRYGRFTKLQWTGAIIVAGAGLLVAAAMAVLFVRWLLSLGFMQDFLAAFPGEYHLPASAPVGFPAWLGWQHFFNIFLMVLIIRSGLRIRTEKRPTAFWTPRRDPKGKVSLTIWFHQSLDILWLVNGIIFVVLLFVTGQWMRVIPTSWEVFPNALSAALQYVSLDWPTENGWVNYNSLQQLAYFTTIFLAAPLAAITGYRMSGMWPKNAKGLNKAYPIEWARAVHFPVMIYFVLFILVHVTLVFATGALRNLNHMFAAQGSIDPNAYADNWAGFWIFVAAMAVVAAGWIAARPLVLAPIARLFGTVSGR